MKPRRRWWRWLLVGLLVMVVGGWCARFWLGERLAGVLQAELAARGFHLSWKSAAFFRGQGISFEGFQLHRDVRRTASLMAWDQVTVHKSSAGWRSLHLHAAVTATLVFKGSEVLLTLPDPSVRDKVRMAVVTGDAKRMPTSATELQRLIHLHLQEGSNAN